MRMNGRNLRKDINDLLSSRGWDCEFNVKTVWNRYDQPELEVYFTKVDSDQVEVIGKYVDWWFNYYSSRRNLRASRHGSYSDTPYAGYSVIQGAFTL